MTSSAVNRRSRQNKNPESRRLLRIASGNAPSSSIVRLSQGTRGQGSCAVFFVTATVENLNVSSASVPLNVCIPANPLRAITASGQGSGFLITQQSDMASIGALYDEFRVDGMAIHFQPTTSGTTQNVRCGIIADYDSEPTAGLFANLKTLMEYENSLFLDPNSEAELIFVPNKVSKAFTPWQSTTNSSVQLGGCAFASWTTSGATSTGNLVIKWRIIARGATF
jgi:hypothetical protein